MVLEFEWAINGTSLPSRHPTPPEWVRSTIKGYAETGFKRLLSLRPQNGQVTMAQLQELFGIGVAFNSVLSNPLASFPSDAPQEVKDMVVDLAESIAVHSAPRIRKMEQSVQKLVPHLRPATLPELQANAEAFTRGTQSVELGDGPARQELFALLWFFWPMFEGIRPARKLYEAIGTVTDQKFGWKSFEAVCADVGIFKGRRGRPRARKILKGTKKD